MTNLRKIFVPALAGMFALSTLGAGADAPPLKIGMVYSYTGSTAAAGPIVDAAMNAWLAQHNGMIAGRKVEIIRRDDTGPAPDIARRLATELVVQDHVDFLVGATYTPNGVAIASATPGASVYYTTNAVKDAVLHGQRGRSRIARQGTVLDAPRRQHGANRGPASKVGGEERRENRL